MNKEKVKSALHNIFGKYEFRNSKDLKVDLTTGYTVTVEVFGLTFLILELFNKIDNIKEILNLKITTINSSTESFMHIKIVIPAHSYEELKSKLGYLKVIENG